jgi:thiol:disulfide interchange protein DsbD
MQKIIAVVIALIVLLQSNMATAQEVKNPVQFAFATKRINDSIVHLTVNATLDQKTVLFGVQQPTSEAFISSITWDSSVTKYTRATDTILTKGNLVVVDDGSGTKLNAYSDKVSFTYILHIPSNQQVDVKGSFNWLAKSDDAFPSNTVSFGEAVMPIPADVTLEATNNAGNQVPTSLLDTFLLSLLAGFAAVFTPCVFPLVPVTVTMFLKRAESKGKGVITALWYSLSIILIYTIPTVILTSIFGDKILYSISTSAVSNLLFFLIFIVFGISLLGGFELQLPNKWANSVDGKASKGGFIGIFFMALTLVIVSFSCTGPLVGLLLGSTSSQGITLAPVLGMLGFSLGLALPFTVFALFPSMIKSLPRSGGWLNSVKVFFGFIELALAMKFLSNVDLIYHWGILDRDVFLSIWIVLFILMGMYLLGKLKFSHDSDLPYITLPRLFFAIAAFCFAVYMIPGLWGAPLKPLSGLIPPATTQDFNVLLTSNQAATNLSVNNGAAQPPKKLTDKLKLPFGLVGYFDLEEGMAAAKALNKPIMLDFTGHSCANCRKMEEEVWSNTQVLNILRNEFVIISLYTDERTELPLNEQYTNASGERITTIGEKNLDYQKEKFKFNAQPLYMFLDNKGNTLSDIRYGYDSDINKFLAHLNKMIAAYKERSK